MKRICVVRFANEVCVVWIGEVEGLEGGLEGFKIGEGGQDGGAEKVSEVSTHFHLFLRRARKQQKQTRPPTTV
jgi:hypothetical protein